MTELFRIRSLDGLEEAEVPEDELLPQDGRTSTNTNVSVPDSDGFMNIPEGADDEGIPFM